MPAQSMEQLVSLCKRRGFIFQTNEIYGGLQGVYDYGPLGVELKENLKKAWWTAMVYSRDDVEGLDASILTNKKVLKYSGHEDTFTDPLVDCKDCKNRMRADHIKDSKCLHCGSTNLTEPRPFNLMFKTNIGPVDDSSSIAYLRPETAQGIFVNFQNVQSTSRQKLPFGIAQIGKAFRNEITTGNFIFRTREFEQMEMEFFCKLDDTNKWLQYWCEQRMNWFESLGIKKDKLRLRAHGPDELAHYSSACYDIEYKFDFGWSELEGIADRGTFDLDQHMSASNKKLTYFDQINNEHFVPAVVESSAGVDRAFLTILADAFTQEDVNGESRTVLKLSPKIAPIKVAVFPLMNKNNMPEVSQKIVDEIQNSGIASFFDSGGSIGKRYRRQDEAGTPFGITVDHDTLEDNTVTLRDRDTMKQERISIDKIIDILKQKLS